ncbi:membrane protein insertase YidC 1 [Coprobacillus sp. CAG:605]|jgi:YidC/Oxa1 family membrane protein insertase|nr:membrane protein insertase YidC 1 [Coprobacillus sp. CAG:605]
MKKNNKIKIFLLAILVMLSTGCTKYVKDGNKSVIYEATGQTLTANILCKPVTEDLYNIYKENEDKLTNKLDELPDCNNFSVTDIKYVSLWESFFVKPLAWIILKVGELVKNYGVAVMLISVLIRAIMIPLTKKSMAQTENLKKAQPEINRLEKKYANKTDNESLMAKSQETMMIYKKYNINPVSGCLTSFIQLPIFFAFLEAINRVPAIFEGTLFNMNLGMTPMTGFAHGNYIYIILLLLIIGSTYVTFKFSMQSAGSTEAERQMKMMSTFMIIMISFASLSLPTAQALYWVVNNVFAIIQNLIVKKLMKVGK